MRQSALPITFIGRRDEKQSLRARLHGERLVTLLGPGGIGKTSLALQVVEEERADNLWPGGVWFCRLEETKNLTGLCFEIASTFNIPLLSDVRDDEVARIGFAWAMRERTLVVLDCIEQLAAQAAPAIAHWLKQAPGCHFLVTSRIPLGLQTEVLLHLDVMSMPSEGEADVEAVQRADAVQLFVQRTRRVRAQYQLQADSAQTVAHLVRRLEGVPLAIELAAARMGVMSPSQMLEKLGARFQLLRASASDVSPRHASLLAAIEWSWLSLDGVERRALTECTVFRGGLTLEAAEAVLTPSPDRPVLALLQSLKDKSLLRAHAGSDREPLRFGLLDTIREYVELQGEVDPAVVQRHASFYAQQAAALQAEQHGPRESEMLQTVAFEHENFRVVLQRAKLGQTSSAAALQVALTLDALLSLRGPVSTQISVLDDALATAAGSEPLALRAQVMRARGRIREKGWSAARLDTALTWARECADEGLQALTHVELSIFHRQFGRAQEARAQLEAAAALIHRVPLWVKAYVLGNDAILDAEQGREAETRQKMQESVLLFQRLGDRRFEAIFWMNLGYFDFSRRRSTDAQCHLSRAISLMNALGDTQLGGNAHAILGLVLWDRGESEGARAAFEQALKMSKQTGDRALAATVVLPSLGALASGLADWGPAAQAFDEARRLLLPDDPNHEFAFFMEGHLDVANAVRAREEGRLTESVELLERAEARLVQVPAERVTNSEDLRIARKTLSTVLERARSPSVFADPSATGALERRGFTWGPYQIHRRLGAGGMGEVWLAQRGQEMLVLKTILPELAEDERFIRQFQREAAIASKVRSSRVVRVLDVGQMGKTWYLGLEYVPGLSLDRLLRRASPALPLPLAVRMGIDLADALADIHDTQDDAGHCLDIVHRDVSPSNVLISKDGDLKLTDFGVAKSNDPGVFSTTLGTIKGKLAYMAPEQAQGLPVRRTADVYAWGIVMYRLLAGTLPYGGTETALLQDVMNAQRVPLQEAVPGLPEGLSSILDTALQKEPAQRFSHARQIARALEAVQWDPASRQQARADLADLVRQMMPSDGMAVPSSPTQSLVTIPGGQPA